jgi:hypothetical protein
MSIWNKVLLGLIFVASLAFFYLATRTLKTHQYWRELARRFEQRIKQVDKESADLLSGNPQLGADAKCIEKYQSELTQLLTDRGRVWYNCTPQKAKPTGEISVATSQPTPHGIADKTVVYAFEQDEADKSGRYIGQFVVSEVGDKQVGLKPARELSPRELQRLTTSHGSWALYERMPFDNHQAFAALGEAEKKAMLPAATVTEYLKDGQPADPNDPKQRVADGKYVRQLRDYRILFERHDIERTELSDLCDAGERDKGYLLAAAANAKKEVEFRNQEIAQLKAALQRDHVEATAVIALHNSLQRKVTDLTAGVAQVIATNKSLAAGIAKIQLEAARRIDDRTHAMAQSGETRK